MADVLKESGVKEVAEADDPQATLEPLRRFKQTRSGHPLEDVKDWFNARKKNPDAPCPEPKIIK